MNNSNSFLFRSWQIKHSLLAALFFSLISQPLFAADVIARLHDFYADVQSMQADFKQELFDNTGELIQSASGKLALQRPGKFRWDYLIPYEQLIVADGKKLWIYDADLEQVTVKHMDKALGNTPAMLLSGVHPLEDDFTITALPMMGDMMWVELAPKGESEGFDQVRLGFDKHDLKLFEMIDGLGQVTRISFNETRKNSGLDQQLFTFIPPPDVDVVGDVE